MEPTYVDQILMCQHPDGPHEHVPLDPGFDPGLCFMGGDCCTPRVYVAADAVVAWLESRGSDMDNEVRLFAERFGVASDAKRGCE